MLNLEKFNLRFIIEDKDNKLGIYSFDEILKEFGVSKSDSVDYILTQIFKKGNERVKIDLVKK